MLIRWLLTTEDTRGCCVSCLHSNHGGEFCSGFLAGFCREQGIRQSWTLPESSQQNGVAERRIGLVMEIARTSLTHARAPHFLWPYAVRYAAHQLNLWPRVSQPEVLPTGLWTGSPGVASRFHVWGCLALVRDTSADKLSPRAVPCVFFGFPKESPDFTFYYPPSHRFFGSRYVRFEEFVPYYVRYPCRGLPVPPPPLFLTPALLEGNAAMSNKMSALGFELGRTIRAELLTIGQEVHMATFAAHVLKGLPLEYGFLRRKLDISSPDMMVERVCSEVLIEEQTLSIEQSYKQITSDASAFAGAVNTIVATTGVNGKEGKGGQEQTDKKKDGKWEKKRAPLKGRCYNCNEEGHMAAKCPNKKKDTTSAAAANVAEGDGKGVSLTVACSAAKLLADDKDLWFLDSGCSQHMTDRKEWFTVIRDPSATKSVKGFDGSMQKVAGAGEVLLEGTNGLHVTLHDVLFVPGMKANLVSPGQLLDKGAKLQTEEGVTRIIASGGQVAATARYRHRLHYLDLKPGPARNGATAAAACNGTAAEAACTNMAGGVASNGTGAAAACNGTAAVVACTNLAGGAASNGTAAAAACNGRAAAAACNGRAAVAACKGTVVAAICNNTAATAACNGTAAEVAGNGMPKIFAEVVSSAPEENDEAASLTTYAVGTEAMLNLRHTHIENDHAGAVQSNKGMPLVRLPTSTMMALDAVDGNNMYGIAFLAGGAYGTDIYYDVEYLDEADEEEGGLRSIIINLGVTLTGPEGKVVDKGLLVVEYMSSTEGYLSLQIVHDHPNKTLLLHQDAYVAKVQQRFFKGAPPKKQTITPLSSTSFVMEGAELFADRTMADHLAAGAHLRTDAHWHELFRTLSYWAASPNMGLLFKGGPERQIGDSLGTDWGQFGEIDLGSRSV
ncbi:unnamed protein product [Closterium sp. NIES-65]|nr:unnamed protein product [Closterium sp. NIES-65]